MIISEYLNAERKEKEVINETHLTRFNYHKYNIIQRPTLPRSVTEGEGERGVDAQDQ